MVRGISMNSHIGNPPNDIPGDHFVDWPKRDMIPQPVNYYVTLDEDQNTINDAFFRVVGVAPGTPIQTMYLYDWPATYHGGATGFSFADGHAELHKWITLGKPPAGYQDPCTTFGRQDTADAQWLAAHTGVQN